MTDGTWTAFKVTGSGDASLVLVCEHASRAIPSELDHHENAQESHAAWDIGALAVAGRLSERLGAPSVARALSRLGYACNRPLSTPDAIATRSEVFDVSGNRDVDDAAQCGAPSAPVTIHSIKPVHLGRARHVDIGFLHAADPGPSPAALAAKQARGMWRAASNEPDAVSDGVAHTLGLHGETGGGSAATIEIRNDLIATDADAARMAGRLVETLCRALPRVVPQAAN